MSLNQKQQQVSQEKQQSEQKSDQQQDVDESHSDEEIDDNKYDDIKQEQPESKQEAIDNQLYTYHSFDEMNLRKDLLRGIYGHGFENPSGVQQKAIVPVIKGKDILCQAQAGTGKTGAFVIAACQIINLKDASCQVLILAPTRELAKQHFEVSSAIGFHLGVNSRALVGGTSYRKDIEELKKGIHLVSGTPGRVDHMLRIGALKLDKLKLFILDECDEMFQKNFKDQIYECLQYLPQSVQVGLYSATIPQDVQDLARKIMRPGKRCEILVKNKELTLEGIQQYYVAVEKEEYKLATLIDLYECLNIHKAILFCNSKRKVIWLTDKLGQNDFSVSALHSDLNQEDRVKVYKEFKCGATRVLIATDIVSRGIDIAAVNLVINYDLPRSKEKYIHRIGRSGRFGRKGVAINFVPDDEEQDLKDIERMYETVIEELPSDVKTITE